ncbi:MAG: hypothetical protein JSW66_08685, partial [Phycisphaerales bacterium]
MREPVKFPKESRRLGDWLNRFPQNILCLFGYLVAEKIDVIPNKTFVCPIHSFQYFFGEKLELLSVC